MEEGEMFAMPDDVIINCAGLALDFGGSLIKVIYKVPANDDHDSPKGERPVYRLRFETWSPQDVDKMIAMIKDACVLSRQNHNDITENCDKPTIAVTGIRLVTIYRRLTSALRIKVQEISEFTSLVEGFNWLWKQPSKEQYFEPLRPFHDEFRPKTNEDRSVHVPQNIHPVLMVQIGSGVGYIKINGDGTCEVQVLDTCQGGSSFVGIASLLSGKKAYEELMDLAESGDASRLDETCHLDDWESCMKDDHSDRSSSQPLLPLDEFRAADMVAFLLRKQCSAITEFAITHARAAGIENIVFSGSFFNHPASKTCFKEMFAAEDELNGFLMKNGGYLGVLGCLIFPLT